MVGRVGHLSFISLDVYCHGRSRGVWRCFIFWYTLDYTAALPVRAQDCVAHVFGVRLVMHIYMAMRQTLLETSIQVLKVA